MNAQVASNICSNSSWKMRGSRKISRRTRKTPSCGRSSTKFVASSIRGQSPGCGHRRRDRVRLHLNLVARPVYMHVVEAHQEVTRDQANNKRDGRGEEK